MYLGDFPTSGKVGFLWNTNAQTGASITRSTDGTLKIFKMHATAATWATERSSLAGVTQLEDFDQTGIHSVHIDLSDNTDAGFYVAGGEYQVAITAATVDTLTVSAVLASFSIERAGGVLALIKAGTVKVDVETVKTQPVTCGAGVTVLASVGTAATSTAQTGDSFPLVSTEVSEIYAAVITNAAGTDIAADIIAVKAVVDTIQADTDLLDDAVGGILDIHTDVAAVKADTAAILVDTGTTLDGRIPAALGADGFMKASVFGMMGTALTETAGQIAAAFTKFFNKAAPTGTINSIPDAVAGAAGGVAIVGSAVVLADGAHGGSAATLALKSVDVTNSAAGGIAVNIVGSGSGNSHALRLQSTNGHAMALGSTSGNAINAASTSSHAVSIAGGTDSDGIRAVGNGTGFDINADIEGTVSLVAAYDSAKTALTTTTTIADADALGANSLLLWIRRMKWMLTNKLAVVDADGTYTLYKDNGSTSAATGSITDDSTTTTRSTPTWA